jgi:hypothetical protein
LIRRNSEGAGLLSPHVELGDARERLDEVTGGGFVVITRGFGTDPGARSAIGAKTLRIGEGGLADRDGRLDAFLDAQGWDAMIVRPDYYIYGGATHEGLPALAEALAADLAANGVAVLQEVQA